MIYKLKRYSKSNIPMRKPDIKFKDNTKTQQHNKEEEEILYEEQPQEENLEDYYVDENEQTN